jgi:hypothetical protein
MTWSKSPAGSGGSGGGATTVDVDGPGDSGQARLNELGYKQELKRDLSYVTPFFPRFRRC